jgi:mono/diheme cytochrome c family protein
MRVFFLSRLRYQWLFVVLMLLVVEAVPVFGAENQGAVSAQSRYNAGCARCHGASGKGNGLQAMALFFMFKVPNLTDVAYMQTRSDDSLFRAIKQGKASMPSFGLKLTDSEIKDLVVYIRSFTKAP